MKTVSFKSCIVAFSVIYLTLTTLVLHADAGVATASASTATPTAATASAATPTAVDDTYYCARAFDRIPCEKLVKGSVNWNQAMIKGLTEAMKHAQSVTRKSKLESLGDSGCSETYVNIQARLKECMELVGKGDTDDSINFKLSASVTSLEDCKNALIDMKKEMTPFYAANRHFDHMLKICLAIDKSKYTKEKN